jgi:hypothetical protein
MRPPTRAETLRRSSTRGFADSTPIVYPIAPVATPMRKAAAVDADLKAAQAQLNEALLLARPGKLMRLNVCWEDGVMVFYKRYVFQPPNEKAFAYTVKERLQPVDPKTLFRVVPPQSAGRG